MIAIAVGIPAALVALVILTLCIPFDLYFSLEVKEKAEFSLRWKWLFGLISRELKPDLSRPSPGRQKKKKHPAAFKTVNTLRKGLELLRTRGLVHQLFLLMKRSLTVVKIRRFEAEFLAGLEDPADTFYLFSLMAPLNLLFSSLRNCSVNLQTSFVGPACEGHFTAVFRLRPLRLIVPGLQFIFSPPVFRLVIKWMSMKWKEQGPRWKARLQPAA